MKAPYPKPKAVGGRLIRELVGLLKASGLSMPFDSHILIAVSGGVDSVALARVLHRYGRRIVDPSRLAGGNVKCKNGVFKADVDHT